jgi:hypothetical protein
MLPPGSAVLTMVAALGVVIVFVTGRITIRTSRHDAADDSTGAGVASDGRIGEASILRWQLALALVAVALIALTIAQHASGGGNAHARYSMPAIGAAAVLVVIGMERIWSRWAPLALVIVAGWWALINLPVDVDPQRLLRNRDDGQLPPYPLRVLPLSDGWRTGAGILIAVGVIVAVAVLVATLRQSPRGRGGDVGPSGYSGPDDEMRSGSTSSEISPSSTPSR